MDIIEKENEILAKLKESGFGTFDGDSEKAYSYFEEQLDKVLRYDEKELHEMVKNRLHGDEFGEQEAVRREAEYERRVSGLEALNKLCADLGLSPLADIDLGDMQAVEEFVGQCRWAFYNMAKEELSKK